MFPCHVPTRVLVRAKTNSSVWMIIFLRPDLKTEYNCALLRILLMEEILHHLGWLKPYE